MDGQRFDDLSRALAHGVSRRAVLRNVGGSFVGAVAAAAGLRRAGAQGGPSSSCADFCTQNYPPGHDRGQCMADAAHNQGDCYVCGPVSSNPNSVWCNGACVDVTTDANNCGACGNACPGPVSGPGAVTCTGGNCAITCDEGYTLCGQSCVELGTADHCANCDDTCAAGQGCCGGQCVSLSTTDHCGACNVTCSGADHCCGDGCQQCCTPDDCPQPTLPCEAATCNGGVCGISPAASGTPCRAASCRNGVEVEPAVCNGVETSCPPEVDRDCAAYACDATSCNTTCTTSSDCAEGSACVSGEPANFCHAGLAPGATCTRDEDCAAEHCVHGICCTQACPLPANGYTTCVDDGTACQANCDTGYHADCNNTLCVTDGFCECTDTCYQPANATATCIFGTCNYSCNPGYQPCGDQCCPD